MKLRKNIQDLLWKFNPTLKIPVSIEGWYGRLNNNIQQIALVLIYAQKNELQVITPYHEYINNITFIAFES